MKVLCYDDLDFKNLFVFDVCAAYYDEDIAGLVLVSSCDSFDMFCFPDMHFDCCNGIIFELFHDDICDLRNFCQIMVYSDCFCDE